MIHRHLDTGLGHLNAQLLAMAGQVECAIERATEGWRLRSVPKLQEVYGIEAKVNRAHIEIDASCIQLLALQQPMAADLRLVVSCIKINSDLERMTDLAVNIANNTEFFLKGPQLIDISDLSQMSDEVRVMVREVLDAFVKTDIDLARRVLHRDDKVDAYKRKIVSDCLAAMKEDPNLVEQGMNVVFMAKNLERIGDHATNIAEDVIFSVSGQDVRHSANAPTPSDSK